MSSSTSTPAAGGSGGGGGVTRVEQGPLIIEDVPPIPESIKGRLFQYQNARSCSLLGWCPDTLMGGGMLISTRFAETSQVHHVLSPLSYRRQLTFFDEPIASARICPSPDTLNGFIYTKDIGGSEFYQAYSFDVASGAYTLLTDGASKNSAVLWNHAGTQYVMSSTRRNKRDHDIYLSRAGKDNLAQQDIILQEGGLWNPLSWSPDDQQVLVLHYKSANESYIHILDINSKKVEALPIPVVNAAAAASSQQQQERISYGAAVWDPRDGKRGVFYTSDEGGEFMTLRHLDLASHVITSISGSIPWNVEEVKTIKHRDVDSDKIIAFTANEDGVSVLYILSVDDKGAFVFNKVDGLPMGQVYNLAFNKFNKQTQIVGFVVNSSLSPGDVYSINLKTTKVTQWTQSEVGGLPPSLFVSPLLIRYKSFDGLTVPSFYYKPTTTKNTNKEDKFPVVIHIHGGPEGQSTPIFVPTYQYILNEMGIALLVPNVRGSAGYGKSYLLMDNGYKREDSVKDIGSLLDWVATQDDLDPTRVAVWGGSYGGYMVLASMIHFGDRLKCGAEIVGISNFVTFLTNTQEYRRDLRREEYGDERDPQMRSFLHSISPTTNASKIKKPMYVAQGANDPRVPLSEADQIVQEIRKNGVEVWYVVAKDEGHGFAKKSNRDFNTNAIMTFFEKHLL